MKVTIDGKQVKVEGKKTLLEVARENGIDIPSLCDHQRLSPFAGCRLCLVQIKGRRGYLPSCSTYVEDGMEVKTNTPALRKLREQILELILSEHPNACLICTEKENCDEFKSTIRKVSETTGCVLCPNNGRCQLQDIVKMVRIDRVRFPSLYRDFDLKKNDPFFDRNYNLCILCGRCVRVCHEIRGASTVTFVYRGSQAVIGTVLDRPLLESGCQFCGACLDVCPTGALTERALKYETLPDSRAKTICPLCSMGCMLELELKNGKILSSRPSSEGAVNQGQACVKGRFVIRDVVHSRRRILKPMIRRKKELEEVNWKEALDFVAQRLKRYKGKEIAFVASTQVTNEDSFLFEKFVREVLNAENVINPAGFSPFAALQEWAGANDLNREINFHIKGLSKAKLIFLVGENLSVSHPLVWLEVLNAVRKGATLVLASSIEFPLNRYASVWLRLKPGSEVYLFNALIKRILESGNSDDFTRLKGFNSFKDSLDKIELSPEPEFMGLSEEELTETVKLLLEADSAVFLFGPSLIQNNGGVQNLAALWNLACIKESRLFPLGLENNLRGVYQTSLGRLDKKLNLERLSKRIHSRQVKALYLTGPIPDLGAAKVDFLVIQDSFMNERVERADAVFPAATFAEVEGTFVNFEGRIQRFEKAIEPQGDSKPDWWIISQLAQRMGNEGFSFNDSSGIRKEMSKELPSFSKMSDAKFNDKADVFLQEEKKGERKLISLQNHHPFLEASKKFPFLMSIDYDLDYYRSLSLFQEVKGLRVIRDSRWIRISPQDAEKLGLKEGEAIVIESQIGKIEGTVKISEYVPEGVISTNFLWSHDSNGSVSRLVSLSSEGNLYTNPLPVRIKRGK